MIPTDEQLDEAYRKLAAHTQEEIRRIYYLHGKEVARDYLIETMKRLNTRQFESRFAVPTKEELERQIREYLWMLDNYQATKPRLLVTEIVLSMRERETIKGEAKELEAFMIKGLRIYRVRRNESNPTLMAAYSPLTGKLHRIGFANILELGTELFLLIDPSGCYSLGSIPLGNGPEPLEDYDVLNSMLVDAIGLGTTWTQWLVRPKPELTEVAKRYLGYMSASANVVLHPEASDTANLIRILKAHANPFDPVWDIVDKFGFPNGPLGDALRHMDKFRTA